MRRALLALLAVAVAGAAVFYLLTMPPAPVPASALPAHTPDLANGKYMRVTKANSLRGDPDAISWDEQVWASWGGGAGSVLTS